MSYTTDLQSNNADLQNILNTVNALPEKIQLPELTNPAGTENIDYGFEAINGNGVLITGTGEKTVVETGTVILSTESKSINVPNLSKYRYFMLYALSRVNPSRICMATNFPNLKGLYINSSLADPLDITVDGDTISNGIRSFYSTTYNYILWN